MMRRPIFHVIPPALSVIIVRWISFFLTIIGRFDLEHGEKKKRKEKERRRKKKTKKGIVEGSNR